MSQKSSVPQAVSFVSQVLKRDSLMSVGVFSVDDDQIYALPNNREPFCRQHLEDMGFRQ